MAGTDIVVAIHCALHIPIDWNRTRALVLAQLGINRDCRCPLVGTRLRICAHSLGSMLPAPVDIATPGTAYALVNGGDLRHRMAGDSCRGGTCLRLELGEDAVRSN